MLRKHRLKPSRKKVNTKPKPNLELQELTHVVAVKHQALPDLLPLTIKSTLLPRFLRSIAMSEAKRYHQQSNYPQASRYPQASQEYNSAKSKAISAFRVMMWEMEHMGAEHVNFHNHFADVQKKLHDMKETYGSKELDVEVVRSTALDGYLSGGNLPKVTALGHFEVEKALKDFQQQEKALDEIHKKTAALVESLLGDCRCTCGDGDGASA